MFVCVTTSSMGNTESQRRPSTSPQASPPTTPQGRRFTPAIGVPSAPRSLPVPLGTPGAAESIAESLTKMSNMASPRRPSTSQPTQPTVFRWKGGGRDVQLSIFNEDFTMKLPMNRSGTEFSTIVDMPEGMHFYRFLIDGVPHPARDQKLDTGPDGQISNVIQVVISDEMSRGDLRGSPPGAYGILTPTAEEYAKAKEPANLPPHLQSAILNTPSLDGDSALLPVPAHVVINHLYSAVRADSVLLMGITHRYRSKFVTTVFYAQSTTGLKTIGPDAAVSS